MRRPICAIGFSFSAAMWAAFQFGLASAPDLAAACGLLALAVVFACLCTGRMRIVALIALSAGLAFAAHAIYYERQIAPFERHAAGSVRFEGVITEVRQQGGRSTRYIVKAIFPEEGLPPSDIAAYMFGEADYAEGDVIGGVLQCYESEYENVRRFYRSRGIRLSGSIVVAETGFSDTRRFDFDRAVILLRGRLVVNLYRNLPASSAALVHGVILGESGNISDRTYTAMQRTGTLHLLSVSGLHLSLFAGVLMILLKRTRLPGHFQSLISLGGCHGFFILAGFSPSLIRALVMMNVIILARLISRRADTLSSLGLALLLICIFRPYWTLGGGMWLSAFSCAGIAVLAKPVSNAISHRRADGAPDQPAPMGGFLRAAADSIGVSAGAYLFTMPLLFLMEGWISLLAPLANLLIAPFAALMMTGGMLCAVLPPGLGITGIIAAVVHFCASLVTGVSVFLSGLPFCALSFDRFWMIVMIIPLIAAAGLIWRNKVARRVWAGTCAVFLLAFSLASLVDTWLSRDSVELAVIGETECFAMLLRGDTAVLLSEPSRYNVNALLRYLRFRGVKRIDALLLPGFGPQIDSGILRLYAEYPVSCVIGPDDAYLLDQLAQAAPGVPVWPCGYAGAEVLGGVLVSFDASGDMRVFTGAGAESAFISVSSYDIMDSDNSSAVRVYPDALLLPEGTAADYEPVGARLFGETRITLKLE